MSGNSVGRAATQLGPELVVLRAFERWPERKDRRLSGRRGSAEIWAGVLRSCSYRTGSGPVVISDSVPMFEEAC